MLLPFTTSSTLGFRKSKPCFQTRPAAQGVAAGIPSKACSTRLPFSVSAIAAKSQSCSRFSKWSLRSRDSPPCHFGIKSMEISPATWGLKSPATLLQAWHLFWAIRTFLDQASHLTELQPNPRHRISTTIFLLRLWDINIPNHPLPHSGQQASRLGLATGATEPWSKMFSPIGVQDEGWRWATICVWGLSSPSFVQCAKNFGKNETRMHSIPSNHASVIFSGQRFLLSICSNNQLFSHNCHRWLTTTQVPSQPNGTATCHAQLTREVPSVPVSNTHPSWKWSFESVQVWLSSKT